MGVLAGPSGRGDRGPVCLDPGTNGSRLRELVANAYG